MIWLKKSKQILIIGLMLLPGIASAHEAYVLPRAQFEAGLRVTSLKAFTALHDPANLRVSLAIVLGVLAVFVANFLFAQSRLAKKISTRFERFSSLGPWLVRIFISASLFFSALTNSFLGPEIPLTSIPYGEFFRVVLFLVSAFILLGYFTEVAALLALVVFMVAGSVYHWYLATYLNYLGELLVLVLFGSRYASIDHWLFGRLKRFPKLALYEKDIVRVFYGLALAYAAVNVKLLHPSLTVDVVNDYHLTKFHWLFPHDPLLVTFGAGLTELAIGLFIALAFELRLTVLVSLFYITLSLIYFREAVWPHLLLYGISISLLIAPQRLSLDNWLAKKFARYKKRA